MTTEVGDTIGPDETTCDAFLGGAVQALQPRRGYRAGLDAVLLAAAVPRSHDARPVRLLDVGAGVGVVGLCAAARLPDIDATMVERSAELCGVATQNIAANGLADRARIIEQDITIAKPHQQLADNSFDVVVANPPFYETARHRQSPHALKAMSHAMSDAGLETWARFFARKTRSGGQAIMIHRADYLPAMLEAFGARFGALCVLPLYPRDGEPASRVLLAGIKGSRAPLTISPGICLHGPGNRFTPMIDEILKTPKALDWLPAL